MSTTTALTGARQATRSIQRPQPLLAVVSWELRRFGTSRNFWLQALGFFCLTLLVTWMGRAASCFGTGIGGADLTFISACVSGTSAWGFEQVFPGYILLLGVILPFVNAESVSRDLSRRTHELLMTTSLPTSAYVWGRYLVGLLMSLGLAVLMLAGIVGMGEALRLTDASYATPVIGNLLILWAAMILPATIMVSAVSFALGTVLPRQANLVKILILIAWFFGVVIVPTSLASIPAWYARWDLTGAATARTTLTHYRDGVPNLRDVTTLTQLLQGLQSVENALPNISAWLAPRLIEAGLSLLLVAVVAFGFQRFRGALSAS